MFIGIKDFLIKYFYINKILSYNYYNFQPGMIDEIIRGLVSTPMENLDQFITGEITNHLFEDKRIPHSGVDLIALNIQRGMIWHQYRVSGLNI